VDVIKNYLFNRRATIETELATQDSPFEISNNGGNSYTVSGTTVVLTGRAPVEVRTIQVTGATASGPITWSLDAQNHPLIWSIPLTLPLVVNNIAILGRDWKGDPLSGYTDSITITRQ
jgi:hypothetical protein